MSKQAVLKISGEPKPLYSEAYAEKVQKMLATAMVWQRALKDPDSGALEQYQSWRVSKIVATPRLKELASDYCHIYFDLLFLQRGEQPGFIPDISSKTTKLLELYDSGKDNPANIAEAKELVNQLKLSIVRFSGFTSEKMKTMGQKLKVLDLVAERENEIDTIAEYAVEVSANHYLNNKAAAMSVIIDIALKKETNGFPIDDAYIPMIRNFLSLFNTNASFMKNATPDQMHGKLYLPNREIPMILFPSDQDYSKQA